MIEVWPVVHVLDEAKTLRNFAIARDCGCPGVFLIAMDGNDAFVDRVAARLIGGPHGLKVGVNYLTEGPADAVQRAANRGFDATWLDDAGIHSDGITVRARAVARVKPKGHRVFAGVAFKGQPHDPDPGFAALMAISLGFVPTTSGYATGVAPEVEKLAAIRLSLSPLAPLAIASGVTPENVASMRPFVTHALVSTGISRSFHEFDEEKLRALMKAANPTNQEPTPC